MAYEGWNNRQTWQANLWLSNDEGLYERINEHTEGEWEDSGGDKDKTVERLAAFIDEFLREITGVDDAKGMVSDILVSWHQAVDCDEIAGLWLESMDLEPVEEPAD